ncbi:unnamed protein product [Rhizophagus irregularis]|nr:unnamed protein product [Rhizophagus irregularis]
MTLLVNRFLFDESLREYEDILISGGKKEELEILQDINIRFMENLKASEILRRCNRVWELLRECEEIAEIEKIKGLKKGDKEKRKERKEGIDDKGGEKKKKKLEKTVNNKQNEKKIEKRISLVTLDQIIKEVIESGKAITKKWGTKAKLFN